MNIQCIHVGKDVSQGGCKSAATIDLNVLYRRDRVTIGRTESDENVSAMLPVRIVGKNRTI